MYKTRVYQRSGDFIKKEASTLKKIFLNWPDSNQNLNQNKGAGISNLQHTTNTKQTYFGRNNCFSQMEKELQYEKKPAPVMLVMCYLSIQSGKGKCGCWPEPKLIKYFCTALINFSNLIQMPD
jgi:hypothetical protein